MHVKDLSHELMREPPRCHNRFKQELNIHTQEIRDPNMNLQIKAKWVNISRVKINCISTGHSSLEFYG